MRKADSEKGYSNLGPTAQRHHLTDQWLNTHNIASTIPGWYERAEEFISSR